MWYACGVWRGVRRDVLPQPAAGQLTPSALAELGWTFSTTTSEPASRLILPVLGKLVGDGAILEDGDPRSIASLACVLSNAGQLKEAVVESIAGIVRRSVGTRHAYDISSLALIGFAGFLTREAPPSAKLLLLRSVAASVDGALCAVEHTAASGVSASRLRVQESLATLAYACSRCGVDDASVYDRISRAVTPTAMTTEQLTKAMWAFSNAGVIDARLSTRLADDVMRRLCGGDGGMDDLQLSAFARALALQAQPEHATVFNKIFEVSALRARGMHPVARSKVYMAHLVATKLTPLKGVVAGLPSDLITHFRDPFVATNVVVSSFHKQIVTILRVLRVPHAVEALLPSGLRVDVLLPDAGVAMEVDGPWHFLPSRAVRRSDAAAHPSLTSGGVCGGVADDVRLNLASRVKRSVLREDGLTVIGIPFFEWMNLRTQSERHDAVLSVLQASGARLPVAVFSGRSSTRNRVTFTKEASHMPTDVRAVARRRQG